MHPNSRISRWTWFELGLVMADAMYSDEYEDVEYKQAAVIGDR